MDAAQIMTLGINGRIKESHFDALNELGDSDSDAELWKREEIVGLDHKMLWFEGKNWDEK